MAITHVAVASGYSNSRYVTLAEFLGVASGFDLAFGALSTPDGDLVLGPSVDAHGALEVAVTQTDGDLAEVEGLLGALEDRAVALKHPPAKRQEFSDEMSPEFD